MKNLFSLGQSVITLGALQRLNAEDVQACLNRHVTGDWGEEMCAEDRAENDRSLREGGRLFSMYRDRNRVKFYIITEHDRSVTTTLLPEDY